MPRARPLLDLLTSPWAIVPDKLIEIQAIYAAHLRGERADIAALELAAGKSFDNDPQGYTVEDGVAIVPVTGVLSKRANMFAQISGGASHQLFARDMRAALADPAVGSILVEIDSPGGSADGTQLAAQAVQAARGVKPVAALADGTMASAAYWIGAWADEVFAVDTTTQLGSIGVVATHVDVSRAEQMMGRKTTEIVAGQYKRVASSYAPLTEAGRASLQDMADNLYAVFVDQVAQARGRSVDTVLADMADGRMFMGHQAVGAGLADGIASRDEILNALRKRAQRGDRSYFVPYPGKTQPMPPNGMASSERVAALLNPRRVEAADPKERTTMHDILQPAVAALSAADFAAQLTSHHADFAAELRAQGAAAERQRIADVRAQLLPGHETLIEQLAADGKTTGPMAAVAVLNAERAAADKRRADLAADAPAPLPGAHTDTGAQDTAQPANKPAAGSHAGAKALAQRIATKQAEARAAGRDLSAVEALALVQQEQ